MTLSSDAFREIRGARLHYLTWGAPAAPPLVLLHGTGADAHQWDAFSPGVAAACYAVAWEQRGHGASGGDVLPPTSTALLDDLTDFVNVMGLDRPVFLGAGDGGLLALRFAAVAPARVRAVITVESAVQLAGEDWRPLIGRIMCPVLMIERDTGGMLARIAGQFVTALRDSRAAFIEGAAAPLTANAPAELARVALAFLDGAKGSDGGRPKPPRPLDLA